MAEIVKQQEMKYVWIEDHYDYHLSGSCLRNGKLCRFEIDDWGVDDWITPSFLVYQLTTGQKISWKIRQKMFEWSIGYHWTYKDGKLMASSYGHRRPKWLWNSIFKTYYGIVKWKNSKK